MQCRTRPGLRTKDSLAPGAKVRWSKEWYCGMCQWYTSHIDDSPVLKADANLVVRARGDMSLSLPGVLLHTCSHTARRRIICVHSPECNADQHSTSISPAHLCQVGCRCGGEMIVDRYATYQPPDHLMSRHVAYTCWLHLETCYSRASSAHR